MPPSTWSADQLLIEATSHLADVDDGARTQDGQGVKSAMTLRWSIKGIAANISQSRSGTKSTAREADHMLYQV